MLRLYVRDNANEQVHEYGTSCHDALILQPDGSLHYENMQSCTGTKCPEEGYSFCQKDGTIQDWDLEYGMEPYIDIAGEYYREESPAKRTSNARPYGVQHGHGNEAPKAPPPTKAGHRRQKGMRRLAVALVGLLGLMLTVVVLAYRYPLQIGALRLCAAAAMAGSCFVCGMIWERAE